MKTRKILALLLALVMLLSLFAGCGKSEPPSTPSEEPAKEGEPAAPADSSSGTKYKEEIKLYMNYAPAGLDAHSYVSAATIYTTSMIHRTLLEYNKDNEIQGCVAESFEWLSDTVLQLKVRPDVMFHNGRQCTAEDIKANIEHVLDPATGWEKQASISLISEVNVIDEYTVQLVLSEPNYGLLDKLTWLVIYPMETAADQNTTPVGCGPFKFVSYIEGQAVNAEKFEDYWDAENIYTQKMSILCSSDADVQAAALQSGEADAILDCTTTADYPLYMNDDRFELVDNQYLAAVTMHLNCEVEPFNDPRVREGLMYLLDYDELIELCTEGYSTRAYYGIMSWLPMFNEELAFDTDPEKGLALLAEAGYPDGFDFVYHVPSVGVESLYGDVIAAQLAKYNINVEVIKEDSTPILARWKETQDYQALTVGIAFSPDDPGMVLGLYYQDNNWQKWDNSGVWDKVIEAGGLTDFDERYDAYSEIWKTIQAEPPILYLATYASYRAKWAGVDGELMRPDGHHDPAYMYRVIE